MRFYKSSSNMFTNKRAFTLIELLVVVLIIGILAAIALPQYQKAVEKSRVAEARAVLNTIFKNWQFCVVQHGAGAEECGHAHLLDTMEISLPGVVHGDCEDTGLCIKTQNWDFGSDFDEGIYANRMKNGSCAYWLTLDFTTGGIACTNSDETFCDKLCGGNHCEVK